MVLTEGHVKPKYLRVSSRYSNIIDVLDIHEMLGLLHSIGFEITTDIPPPEFLKRLKGAGYLGRKGQFNLYLDVNRQVIRLVSFEEAKIESMVEELKKIEDKIHSELYINLKPYFYEFVGEYTILSKGDPIKKFNQLNNKATFIFDLRDIVGMPNLSLYGIRLCQGDSPDSPNWMDLQIEPQVYRSNKAYHLTIVYRNEEWEAFVEFTNNAYLLIDKIVGYLEGIDE
jgi:hypothetical protein